MGKSSKYGDGGVVRSSVGALTGETPTTTTTTPYGSGSNQTTTTVTTGSGGKK